MLTERYVNPFTDFGFKKLFGTEVNKDILIDFLNELLKGKEKIKSLTYKTTEFLGNTDVDRRAVFDLYCENEYGEKFIVEIQKAKQRFFKDRTLFYSTFPIQEQAQKGVWDFELKSVYTIAILDFTFEDDEKYKDKVVFEVKLSEMEHHQVFYDKLTFIYLAMPNFHKQEHELKTKFDKWLYAIKNLPDLKDRPAALQERIFKKFFEMAEIAKFTPEENKSYESSLKIFRDLNNILNTAQEDSLAKGREQGIEIGREQGIEIGREEGIEQGREEGIEIGREEGKEKAKIEMILNLKKLGISDDVIAKSSGFSLEEVNNILLNK